MEPTEPTGTAPKTGEREDLLAMVADQRTNFLYTVAGLTDEQARTRSTVSELTLGGLVKHLAEVQRSWLSVIDGTAAPEVGWADLDPDGNRMTDGETLMRPPRRVPGRGGGLRPGRPRGTRSRPGDHPAALPLVAAGAPRLDRPARPAARVPRDRPPQRPRGHRARGPRRGQHDGADGEGGHGRRVTGGE